MMIMKIIIQKYLQPKKTNERAIKAMKCKGNEICNTALEKNVQKGVHINPNGLQLSPKSTQSLFNVNLLIILI